ncbi:MAG: phosphatase PAP2 family protein [Thermoanaerobaculia bacterium]|nr:hypothetical protein [Thermoanaerobaculia bacterium]MCK6685079.1 phosphatase PAP2 family protein [Thermoanaerobaculia bacterium]
MLKRAVRIHPADVLPLLFSTALLFLAGICWRSFEGPQELLKVGLALGVSLASGFVRARLGGVPAARAASDFAPMLSLMLIFDSLGPFIRAAHPIDRDSWLIAADRFVFGMDPTLWLEPRSTAWLSDILTVCYALFFFFPLILAIVVYRKEDGLFRPGFSRLSVVLLMGFFLSYCGYFAVPATGPRFNITHTGPLPRGPVGETVDRTLDRLETNKRNCFPSGHTAVTIVVLIEAWVLSRRTFWTFLFPCFGLILATVYGRYHYATDVLAGGLLALAVPALGTRLHDWLQSRLKGTWREKSL